MVKNKRGKTFSCMKCGETFEAHPPDDFHQVASIKPDGVEDPIKVEYRCKGKGCNHVNVLYWGYQKMSISVG